MCEWDTLLTPQKDPLVNLRTPLWYVHSHLPYFQPPRGLVYLSIFICVCTNRKGGGGIVAILGDQLFDRDPNCRGPGNTSWLSGSRCQAVSMATRVYAPLRLKSVKLKQQKLQTPCRHQNRNHSRGTGIWDETTIQLYAVVDVLWPSAGDTISSCGKVLRPNSWT